MKKYFLLIGFLMCCMAVHAFADTVYLKDGRVIQGEIIEETRYSVKIKVGRIPKVFYSDEFDRVEYADKTGENDQEVEPPIPEEVSEEKRKLILRLMKANGSADGIRDTLRFTAGNISPEKRKALDEYLNAEELTKRFIPIYAQYFTEEEIRELIRFYTSPVGKRNLEVTPKIMEESMKSAVEYFKSLGSAEESKP